MALRTRASGIWVSRTDLASLRMWRAKRTKASGRTRCATAKAKKFTKIVTKLKDSGTRIHKMGLEWLAGPAVIFFKATLLGERRWATGK